MPVERLRPVDHIRYSHSLSFFVYVEAFSVVCNDDPDAAVGMGKRNRYVFCLGIFDDVVDLFLDDPVDIQFQFILDAVCRDIECLQGLDIRLIDQALKQLINHFFQIDVLNRRGQSLA